MSLDPVRTTEIVLQRGLLQHLPWRPHLVQFRGHLLHHSDEVLKSFFGESLTVDWGCTSGQISDVFCSIRERNMITTRSEIKNGRSQSGPVHHENPVQQVGRCMPHRRTGFHEGQAHVAPLKLRMSDAILLVWVQVRMLQKEDSLKMGLIGNQTGRPA